MTTERELRRFLIWAAVICAILVCVRVAMGTQTQSAPSENVLATRTTPGVLDWSRMQTTTCGNVEDEVTTLSIYTTTTMVAIWCTGENAMVNWWATAATDLASSVAVTTNGWLIVKDTAPERFDGFTMGVSGESDCLLWFASRSSTSATLTVLEFQDTNL